MKETTITKLKRFALPVLITCSLSMNMNAQSVPEVLHYKFDGTGTSVPNLASAPPAGTTTATIMGGLTQGSAGQCQGALIGTGVSSSTDYLNTGYAPNLTGSWTISMWTKDITASATLFYIFGDGTANSFRCFTNGVAGANNWMLRGGGLVDILVSGGATVAPHVTTFVYDAAASNVKAYLDGVLINTVAQTAVSIVGAGPFKVMGYNTNVGSPAWGLLDEFRMYNRALSAAEVLLLTGPAAAYSSLSVSNCASYTVPSGDTTYTTSGIYNDTIPATGAGCGDSIITINLTINSLPIVVANASALEVCAGSSATVYGSGATSYTWSGSVTDNIAFTPLTTNTYIVTGTDGNGCQNSDTVTVTVNALPTVVANAVSTAVCEGSPAIIYGSGATSYAWTGSVLDSIGFTPVITDTYTVTGTDVNGCQNTDSITLTVNTLPAVVANSIAPIVCAGSSVTVYGSGAISYTWTGSVIDSAVFTPVITDTYIVTGTDVNGCQNTDTVTITVNALPTVVANTVSAAVCTGSTATVYGSGALSYTWTGSVTDNVAFTPAATNTYTVTGTDVNGCQNTDNVTVTVNFLPSVTLTLGNNLACVTDAGFVLTGESPVGGNWSGTGVMGGMFDPGTAGAGVYAIEYVYTDINGCSASAIDSMTVSVCTGIATSAEKADFVVYPNPTSGEFMIRFNAVSSSGFQIEVSNSVGEIVNTFKTSSLDQKVDLSEMADGLYLVKVIAGDKVSIQRIVKM